MEVLIDGVKYIPAKDAIANRDAIIRGLLDMFWGELGESYDEDEKCDSVYCIITDSPEQQDYITVQEVADKIAEYSKSV